MYEVRQIDAWADEGGWVWNTSYPMGRLATRGKNDGRALIGFLNRHGVAFKPGKTRIEFDGSVYEVVDRKTGEPLFAAVPME